MAAFHWASAGSNLRDSSSAKRFSALGSIQRCLGLGQIRSTRPSRQSAQRPPRPPAKRSARFGVIDDWRMSLERAGVGEPTMIKALGILQGVMKYAAVRGEITPNPIREISKPKQRRTRVPEPLAPVIVETICSSMGQHDATLVSLLAYAGLRPEEATYAQWERLHERTLEVPRRSPSRIGTCTCSIRSRATWPNAARLRTPAARVDHPPRARRVVGRPRLAQLAASGVRPGPGGRRQHGRHAALPAAGVLRVAPAVGGPLRHLRGGAARTFGRHAGAAPRGGCWRRWTPPTVSRLPRPSARLGSASHVARLFGLRSSSSAGARREPAGSPTPERSPPPDSNR
jgi:hypothetical protein